MKIALTSDIHLEFGPIELENTENADVLILSGDIMVAADINRLDSNMLPHPRRSHYDEFLDMCSRNFPKVIYVMGNHEHYHGDYATTSDILRSFCSNYPNIHFLDNELLTIDDFTFVGGTLWTDMNKEDPNTLRAINSIMNDFRVIKNSNKHISYYRAASLDPDNLDGWVMKQAPSTFSPMDAVDEHKQFLEIVKNTIDSNPTEKIVVVGHHAPSKLSTHPRYKDEVLVNGAYSSDLSEFILDNPQIKLWTHGHTHEPFDYMIGSTRVVCNPRGYFEYEDRADQFELKFLEI
jgi:predicted phosphodiesterase